MGTRLNDPLATSTLRLTAWATPRAFLATHRTTRNARPAGHAVKRPSRYVDTSFNRVGNAPRVSQLTGRPQRARPAGHAVKRPSRYVDTSFNRVGNAPRLSQLTGPITTRRPDGHAVKRPFATSTPRLTAWATPRVSRNSPDRSQRARPDGHAVKRPSRYVDTSFNRVGNAPRVSQLTGRPQRARPPSPRRYVVEPRNQSRASNQPQRGRPRTLVQTAGLRLLRLGGSS